MTTIVYDHKNKLIAIDSRFTSGAIIATDEGVKWFENDKGIWFIAGKPCDRDIIMNSKHNDKPETTPDCHAVFVNKDSVAFNVLCSQENEHIEHDEITHDFTTGSGKDFALAALDMGKSAHDAVEYAMTRDIYSGGKVNVYDIEQGIFI